MFLFKFSTHTSSGTETRCILAQEYISYTNLGNIKDQFELTVIKNGHEVIENFIMMNCNNQTAPHDFDVVEVYDPLGNIVDHSAWNLKPIG